ncbi:LysR family transcriptional regulator [Rhizobacter sp. P5_C2]
MRDALPEEITFRKLEILLAYMDAGTLTRAAQALGINPVSVHRALHSLEDALRCPLFRAEGRNLMPTSAASVLAGTAHAALKVMREGVNATRAAGGYLADSVCIGSLYSLGVRTIPGLVTALKLRRPSLQTDVSMGSNVELLTKLRAFTVDAALMVLPDSAQDIESIPLFEDQVFFAAPANSKYAQMDSIDLGACGSERFVSLTEGFATRNDFAATFAKAGYTPQVALQVGDIFTLINFVSGGVGCTLLPGRVRDVLNGSVQLIPLHPRFAVRQQIGLSYLRARERDPNLLTLASACRLLLGSE